MPESLQHLRLVERILSYLRKHYVGVQQLATLHDLPGVIGCDKPPKIGVYRPDIYAIDAPLTTTIVGEAKTQSDLETQHTREQFLSFMEFLRLQPKPVLVVAVPWQVKTAARSLLDGLARHLQIRSIELVVLDDVESLQ